MTIECVDGQMATPHITGAQKGAMHAGVVGDGCYVLATGNKCKATQNSATSVTIGTGDLFIHGRHHQITAAETVTIQSGTQGQKRNDLICAVYHRDAQGIEQPTVTVLKGTPTTGTPADPTVPAGNVLNGDAVDYFPLYRVSLNGTTASAPVQLFKVLPTLASLGDSVSQMPRIFIGTIARHLIAADGGFNVFTRDEYVSLVGRPFDQNRDYVAAMNADGGALNAGVYCVTYYPGGGNLFAGIKSDVDVDIRINYLVVCGGA